MKVRKLVIAALATCGVVAMASPAAQARSASSPTWKKQAPAAHPTPRFDRQLAYDQATGTAVLFGGNSNNGPLSDTWTWNGKTWTRQHPAASPRARDGADMAYDAASSSVVLFGGFVEPGVPELVDTWTWG
jgi:hypothetical protein